MKLNPHELTETSLALFEGRITPLEAVRVNPGENQVADAKAVSTAFAKVKDVAAKYGPEAVAAAQDLLSKATNGQVSNVKDVATYVGGDARRAKIVTDSLVRAGFSIDDVLPQDMTGSNGVLAQIRVSALALANSLQAQYERGSDKTLNQGTDQIAADVLRRERVKAVLRVYGTKENYFLCHPKGEIPIGDFVWYDTVITRGR